MNLETVELVSDLEAQNALSDFAYKLKDCEWREAQNIKRIQWSKRFIVTAAFDRPTVAPRR